MSFIFGNQNSPTKINQVRINQCALGYAVPIVLGRGKIQQSILWTDGFSSKKISGQTNGSGGKGFGGGKSGGEYDYSADLIAGLCNGPIVGIGDVWSGQNWLSNSLASETTTIVSGTPYTPTNAANMTADTGVYFSLSYSQTVNDIGSGGAVTLSGTTNAPLKSMPYGTTLASGEYSVNAANNQYNFATADAGKTVTLSYSFALATIQRQQLDIIPSGRTINVGSSTTGDAATPWVADDGVVYDFEDTTNPLNGVALTRVSGTPTATGTYSISGTEPATYHFASGDINNQVRITYKLDNTKTLLQGTPQSLNFTIFEGNLRQGVWSLLSSSYPGAALGYSGIATANYAPMDLGVSGDPQQNTFEVITPDGWGGGVSDCSPVRCILQVVANPIWGLGNGPVPFPTSAIDNGSGGTWGPGQLSGAVVKDSTATSWFAANGFFISPVIDRQDTGASLISKWLEAGQCAAFMSEGLFKLVPYGDTSTAGNGVVWIAPSEYAAVFDDDDFIPKGKGKGKDPVKISSTPWQDAFNKVQVQWTNRAAQYGTEITPESDQAAINRYGSRIEDPQSWDFITTLPSATFAASMRVKRNVYTRNTYEFSLGFRDAIDLDNMDVIRITTASSWATASNQNLGLVTLPVRITRIVDNPDGTYDITAEDYPFGVHAPNLYNKNTATGTSLFNVFADPGDTVAIIFEATNRLTGYQGDEIWIGAVGANANWGGCNVLASMDGDKYKSIGTITTFARLGTLASSFGSGSDPDTSDSLVVNLAENCEALEAGTTSDADQANTLCFVDGELLSYSACSITGQQQYTMDTYIRRGQMGSSISSHASGSLFLRLDGAVFKYKYDPSWYGKTVQLKFQSFNTFDNALQDPSTLTAVSFTVPGLNPGTIDASTGLVESSGYLPPNVSSNVAVNAQLSSAYDSGTSTSNIDIFGPGGVGTDWSYQVGATTKSYSAGVITGLPTATVYYVAYNIKTNVYVVSTTYTDMLNDYYIYLGSITTATVSGGSTGGFGGGGSGGYGCTVEGTELDTPDGPVSNTILMERLDRGEPVYLMGRHGPERIESAKWIQAALYEINVGAVRFYCSGSHMLRTDGHYFFVSEIYRRAGLGYTPVETLHGYENATIRPRNISAYVFAVHLDGPSHEYSVGGVWTHNIKIAPPA